MKATKATFKSFIKKNAGNIYILVKSSFDGMVDGCSSTGQRNFVKAETTERNIENTVGINGVWLVGSSRDYFTPFENESFVGFEVMNCCGYFKVAVPK